MNEIVPGTASSSAAILFADVKGYAVLVQRDEVDAYDRLKRARALFREIVGDYSGRIVDEAGDGIMLAFAELGNAVDFALAMQRDLANAATWQGKTGPFAFRIGIHAGPVHFDGQQPFGHTVIVAQRIQEVTPPGRVCVSASARAQLVARRDLSFSSLGMRLLKNIEPIEIFRVESEQAALISLVAEHVVPSVPAADEGAIAMLPLQSQSGERSDDLLCDGITTDIIERISRFRDLSIIARHSAFRCRELMDAPSAVGQLLGVRYVALGTVRRSGSQLRITVQLLEAESGRLLWADRFNCDLQEVFAFQDEVADTIAARLAGQVSAAERRRILASPEPTIGAYGLYLRGQDLMVRYYRREANTHARRLFEESAKLDPSYGRPYAGLSRTFNLAWRYRWTEEPVASLERATVLARRAIDQDDLDGRAFAELGYACLYQKRHVEAMAAYERAIELNPNDADVLAEMSDALTCIAEPNRAVELMRRAMRLNPWYPDWYLWNYAEALFDLGQYTDVVATLAKMRDPTEGHRLLAASYALLGQLDMARQHAEAVRRAHPNFSLADWREVTPNVESESQLRYFEGLRRAGLE